MFSLYLHLPFMLIMDTLCKGAKSITCASEAAQVQFSVPSGPLWATDIIDI